MTVNLPDIIESTLEYKLTPTNISVKAKAGKCVQSQFGVPSRLTDYHLLTFDLLSSASKGIEEKEYEFSLDFYSEVVPEVCYLFIPSPIVCTLLTTHLPLRSRQESTKKLSSRSLYLILRKKEHQQEFWPRLTKEKIRTAFVKTDFGKWVDEDEQDGEPVKAEEDMDPMGGGMGGMGGMPGMEGMDLEKVRPSALPFFHLLSSTFHFESIVLTTNILDDGSDGRRHGWLGWRNGWYGWHGWRLWRWIIPFSGGGGGRGGG